MGYSSWLWLSRAKPLSGSAVVVRCDVTGGILPCFGGSDKIMLEMEVRG